RYDRSQPTPWLWVSEGITDYYSDLAMVRGGVVDAPGFYGLTTEKMSNIAQAPPFSVEDASLNAWIKIRDASDNRSSLDNVMRDLYRSTYKQGRGFTADDWWGAVQRASNGRSYDDFKRRYIDGREPYPWAEALSVI